MKIFVSALLLLSFLSACEQAMMDHGMAADSMAADSMADDGMADDSMGAMAGG